MTRRVVFLALMALLLLTLSGSISADDPAPAEIVWLSTGHFRFPWFYPDGTPVMYPLNVMRVFANDSNGNVLFTADGTIDYEAYATIEEACDLFQEPPFGVADPCNTQRNGAMSITGVSTCIPCDRRAGGQLVDRTYNWTAVFTPSGNVEVHCNFTPGSEVPPQQCME